MVSNAIILGTDIGQNSRLAEGWADFFGDDEESGRQHKQGDGKCHPEGSEADDERRESGARQLAASRHRGISIKPCGETQGNGYG